MLARDDSYSKAQVLLAHVVARAAPRSPWQGLTRHLILRTATLLELPARHLSCWIAKKQRTGLDAVSFNPEKYYQMVFGPGKRAVEKVASCFRNPGGGCLWYRRQVFCFGGRCP